jgi:hemerythrin
MRALKWSTSHAVFVREIDDDHREIFAAISALQKAMGGEEADRVPQLTRDLAKAISGHFGHEERIMRAARYGLLRWHKQQHDHARKRVGRCVARIAGGESSAGMELAEYLNGWLHDHTRLADQMMGAFLRNQRRTWTMTFQAGTKPLNACEWKRADGGRLGTG